MREILFRGKTLSRESQWVEGYYNHIPCGRFLCDEHCIQTIDEDGRIGQLFNVYESTVGQYTGLTDKNGKKIFEGDIVRYFQRLLAGEDYEHKDPVLLLEGGFTVGVYFLNNWLRDVENGNIQLEGIEVIGNIHDNPELLEVE